MGDTSIEWTHFTFNPWLGCAKVHAGCANCYAEKHQAVRMRQGGPVDWGEVWQGGKRVVVADSTWKKPLQWAREAAGAGQRRRVFCASLADVLEQPSLPDVWPGGWSQARCDDARARVWTVARELEKARDRLWDTIRHTADMGCSEPNCAACIASDCARPATGLDWLLLTKRPENWRLVPEDVRPLVWLGTSIADQKTADELLPRLLEANGFRYRFVSAEPLVGPVDLTDHLTMEWSEDHGGSMGDFTEHPVDWVIVGGESGRKARPFNIQWAERLVRQCKEAGVACFVKQLGAHPYDPREAGRDGDEQHPGGPGADPDCRLNLVDPKGGDWDEWADLIRVRQWPDEEGR